ncbi:glutathionylspermidine synthase family protein [Solibacillus sp. MA9]|uniref:Glutathionylspermidine synthase family protein n=1 Tax=Solibacillus palustris TaxID=2908203 RepID=A0ABS9UIL1_9BACL|nr:glutathionylspermidine synthase family protein [Solibacillus sp. MA9]MCH7323828.1 glutathionylspermidine synthase family protein [Solibacillus sp. MA9]
MKRDYSKRQAFYAPYKDSFFADFVDLEYALYDVMVLPEKKIEEIRFASQMLWGFFCKIARVIPTLPKEQLLALGFRKEMLAYLNLDYLEHMAVLARFDFICTDDGRIKCIELNGDTPFLVQETFEMNEKLCAEFGVKNPNDTKQFIKGMSQALFQAMQYLNKTTTPKVVITGKEAVDDIEEHCQVKFMQRVLPFDVEYVPIKELIINNGSQRGLYTANMERIDILYRPAHPIEFLLDDVAEDGDRIGLQLLDLVRYKELAIINAPAAYLLQSKILLWLIWERRNDETLFTKHERGAIKRYMLPTFLSDAPFLDAGRAFVKKPVFSREGNTVEIFDVLGNMQMASPNRHYTDNLYLYQEFVEMPNLTIRLQDGEHMKKWLIGSFMVDGNACGLACRVGNAITEWDSHWLAVGSKYV